MATFKAPIINVYSRDLPGAVAFYSELGIVETFRTPASGEAVHIQLTLDKFTLWNEARDVPYAVGASCVSTSSEGFG
jgi:hypothetical protein